MMPRFALVLLVLGVVATAHLSSAFVYPRSPGDLSRLGRQRQYGLEEADDLDSIEEYTDDVNGMEDDQREFYGEDDSRDFEREDVRREFNMEDMEDMEQMQDNAFETYRAVRQYPVNTMTQNADRILRRAEPYGFYPDERIQYYGKYR